MITVCFSGSLNNITFIIHLEENEYIAEVDYYKEHHSKTFHKFNTAKRWVSKIIEELTRNDK